jgi:hypothetical protein
MEEESHRRASQSGPEAEPSSATSEKHPAPSSLSGPQDPNDKANKRRRGLGIVTPNACTECRKKRAKVRLPIPTCFSFSCCHALRPEKILQAYLRVPNI